MKELTHILNRLDQFDNIMLCDTINGDWVSFIDLEEGYKKLGSISCSTCVEAYALHLLGEL